MFGNMSGPTLLVILFIVLLLFGAPKLPALARSLGQSMKILKKEVTPDDTKTDVGTATGDSRSDVGQNTTQNVAEAAEAQQTQPQPHSTEASEK